MMSFNRAGAALPPPPHQYESCEQLYGQYREGESCRQHITGSAVMDAAYAGPPRAQTHFAAGCKLPPKELGRPWWRVERAELEGGVGTKEPRRNTLFISWVVVSNEQTLLVLFANYYF